MARSLENGILLGMEATVHLPEALANRLARLAAEEGTRLDGLLMRLVLEHINRRHHVPVCRKEVSFPLIPKQETGIVSLSWERGSTRSSVLTISLPDVNILLALLAEGHTHHESAREWFRAQANDSAAICRVTQMGLLRLLTNPKVLPQGVCSIHRAREISNEVRAEKRVCLDSEPPRIEAAWMAMMQHPAARPSSWTDAYLAAFAQQREYQMVTFDRDFRRWHDIAVSVLI